MQLIRSIGNMIGYKKSLSEWQCLSEVKMGRGSPIPPMLRRKIVEQYQKGVSQRQIAKSLKLSSSTVHNLIQRFRESGTISVRKGQGRKTILDARDLRALRRHCITYRNATVMEITTWAEKDNEIGQVKFLLCALHNFCNRALHSGLCFFQHAFLSMSVCVRLLYTKNTIRCVMLYYRN